MSRNLATTHCDGCGFWRFDGERELPIDAEGLLTEGQYLAKIGWIDCPYPAIGYGYRRDLEGYESEGYIDSRGLHVRWTYVGVPLEDRYRYRYLECPLCAARFVGWYVRQPRADPQLPGLEPPHYQLYDLSYWHAFNDEPSDADRPRHEITPTLIRDAVTAWRGRQG